MAWQRILKLFTTLLSPFNPRRLSFYSQLSQIIYPSSSDLLGFRFSAFPLQTYLILLFHLPLVYEARITGSASTPPAVPLRVFITEWKSLKAINTLILSAIPAIFQLPGAFADPLLRLAGFLSISFSFFGFHYGCLLINQLDSSSTPGAAVTEDVIECGGTEFQVSVRANRWTWNLNAHDDNKNGYWNASVLLALPAIWTIWSIIGFIFTFVLLLCRSTSVTHASTVTEMELIPVMLTLVVGVVYFVLAIRALRSW